MTNEVEITQIVNEVSASIVVNDVTVETLINEVLVEPVINQVNIQSPGPQGPPGPAGSPGGSRYEHIQVAPSTTWVITHNLGYYPVVSLLDTNGERFYALEVHNSTSQTTITMNSPIAGRAEVV